MRRRKYIHRRAKKKIIGCCLLGIGISIVAVILLPPNAWIVLGGIIMIYIGYKLFCGSS
ncbi:hypothetical protein [Anaerophilus nitritogenes]|uniref:hypothetical protein n=1 Tax=Anaerophilus nitritogenes TaxID=2498136 RepID=UPI0013ED2FA3|nr:hypothetical protein [Anaerophilus nitritogenes]